MMREQDLQELAELVTGDEPVLSLYLHLDRHNRSTDEHKLALRKLLEEASAQGAAAADIERIERFFEHEFDRQAKSVACFSCQARKFWRDQVAAVFEVVADMDINPDREGIPKPVLLRIGQPTAAK